MENLWGFKDTVLLLGLQLGYTKFRCFLCEWDSNDRKYHYLKNSGLNEDHIFQDRKNLVNMPFINPEKVYLPLLHIKLGLIQNFVKTMDQNTARFIYLENKFPRISDVEIKE